MRAVSAILAAVVVLMTSAVSHAQTAPDRKPPVIKHTPVGVAREGTDITIVADIRDDSGIFAPMLWYRSPGAETYSSVDLVLQADKTYLATIPGTESVEYWLEAYDELGNGPARAGTPEKPFHITVKAGPAPAANSLLATAPKGDEGNEKAAPGAPPLTFVAVTPDPAFGNAAPTGPTSLLKNTKEIELKPAIPSIPEAAPTPVVKETVVSVPPTTALTPPAPAAVKEAAPIVAKESAPADLTAPASVVTPSTTPPAPAAPAVVDRPAAAEPVPAPAVVEEAPKPAEIDLNAPVVKRTKKSRKKDDAMAAELAAKTGSEIGSAAANTTPIYKRWWFIGGTGVVAAAGVGLLVYALLPNTIDQNVFTPTMRRP